MAAWWMLDVVVDAAIISAETRKAMKIKKRSSYLLAREIHLGKRPIKIWGYDQTEKFVCRLEINAAKLKVFSGKTGGKCLANWNWEELVSELKKSKT